LEVPEKRTRGKTSTLTVVLISVIVAFTVLGIIICIVDPNFVFSLQPGVGAGEPSYVIGGLVYEIIYVLLLMATYILYLAGGGIIFFGGALVTVRFVQSKLRDPDKPSGVSRNLAGYLNLGLAFFIGAEIIRTVVLRNTLEFELLGFIIASRGLFSLILYLERRWHGTAETE